MRILFTSDLHIGRRSSRTPATLEGLPTSAACTWERIAKEAIASQVDLVLLGGDVVDQDNRFYEAIGPLERGLARLGEAGIRTLAVAGNHDYDVLIRLASSLAASSFQLLGKDGAWERAIIPHDGRPVLAIDGWSFPGRYVERSPVDSVPKPAEGVPTLVMVHGELDNPASCYAPLDRNRMLQHPVAGWLLGHIHAPYHIHDAGRPFILNPGSPQALDPGETGVHGPWLIELSANQPPTCRQIPLSTVRYENVQVTLENATERSGVDSTVLGAMRESLRRATATSGQSLRHLVLRITLDGFASPRLITQLPEVTKELSNEDNALGEKSCSISIDKLDLDVAPIIDLNALSKERNAAAEIARLVLAIDAGSPLPGEYEGLRGQVVEKLREVHEHKDFHAIATDAPPTEAEAQGILRRQANALLATLLAGRASE